MRKIAKISPLSQIYDLGQAPLNASPFTGQWPCMNVRVSSNRIERRWDHEVCLTMAADDVIQAVPVYRSNTDSVYILILTETDLAKVMGGTGETYQYLTETYTTGTITNVSGTTVTGSGTDWDLSGIGVGDKFILDLDHSAAAEPDVNWATVASVDSGTQITLSSAYTGASTTGTYKARKVYSVPSGERWTYASVAGKFCFGNGNIRMQYWDGTSTYATDLNASYANQVRYCTTYADRLVTADVYNPDTTARDPWLLRWSANGDPTNWDDDTAGFNAFIDSDEPITGVGTSGNNIVVFKKTSFYLGYRTSQPTSPITFPTHSRGVGLYAPYSLVHAMGTVLWEGLDDFYIFNGSNAVSIGNPIRKRFFELVSDDEATRVFGVNNARFNEIIWVANTSDGQYVFTYNWKENLSGTGTWATYQFDGNISGLGGWGG